MQCLGGLWKNDLGVSVYVCFLHLDTIILLSSQPLWNEQFCPVHLSTMIFSFFYLFTFLKTGIHYAIQTGIELIL